MTRLTESQLEDYVISTLTEQGYNYVYAPEIAVDGSAPERSSYQEVMLLDRLKSAIRVINPLLPAEAHDQAVREVMRLGSTDTLVANERFQA